MKISINLMTYFSGNAAKAILENYEKVIDLPMILALLEEFRDILKELLLRVSCRLVLE